MDNIRSGYTGNNEPRIPTQKFRLADILIPGGVCKTDAIERTEENLKLLKKTQQAQVSILQLKKKPIENIRINI